MGKKNGVGIGKEDVKQSLCADYMIGFMKPKRRQINFRISK